MYSGLAGFHKTVVIKAKERFGQKMPKTLFCFPVSRPGVIPLLDYRPLVQVGICKRRQNKPLLTTNHSALI
jgi:hypothetical protein